MPEGEPQYIKYEEIDSHIGEPVVFDDHGVGWRGSLVKYGEYPYLKIDEEWRLPIMQDRMEAGKVSIMLLSRNKVRQAIEEQEK